VFWSNELTSDDDGNIQLPAHPGLLLNLPRGYSIVGDLPDGLEVQDMPVAEPSDRMPDDLPEPLEVNPPPGPQASSDIIY
jgi:hypothetical protein